MFERGRIRVGTGQSPTRVPGYLPRYPPTQETSGGERNCIPPGHSGRAGVKAHFAASRRWPSPLRYASSRRGPAAYALSASRRGIASRSIGSLQVARRPPRERDQIHTPAALPSRPREPGAAAPTPTDHRTRAGAARRHFLEAVTAVEHRAATDSAPARPRRPSPARAARRRACRRAFRPPHGGRAARRAARRRASPADALTAPSAGRQSRRPASLLSSARRRPAGRARRGGAVRHALSRRAATVQRHIKSQHELLCVPVSVW